MSNRTSFAVIGTIIAMPLCFLLVHKWEDCAERGGKACPAPRVQPYQPGKSGDRTAPE